MEGSTARAQLSTIADVEAKDPRTLVLTTNRPAAELPYVLSTGYGSIINPKALDKPDLDRAPEGSGPYVATQVSLGDGVVYERRADFDEVRASVPGPSRRERARARIVGAAQPAAGVVMR